MSTDAAYRAALHVDAGEPLPNDLGQTEGHARVHAQRPGYDRVHALPDMGADVVSLANVSSELERTVQAALLVADDLERQGYLAAGVIRALARMAVQGARHVGHDRCPVDGRPLVQPRTGRRRIYCSTRCRNAAVRN